MMARCSECHRTIGEGDRTVERTSAGGYVTRWHLACREVADARLAAHVKKVVDEWPPLTPEQRDRLALLLRPAPTIEPVGASAVERMLQGEKP